MAVNAKNQLLRHFLATLAYRAAKAIRGAPTGFSEFEAGCGVRKPVEIISHMSAVLVHARSFLAPQTRNPVSDGTWEAEVGRFYELLRELDRLFESGAPLTGRTEEQLLQGPLADAMSHVGQLAMLRRLASSPIPKESFDEAAIRPGDFSSPLTGR